MNTPSTCLSVLVLTEDSGTKSFETLRALARALLKQVDERVQTHKVSFEPVRNELALQALHANLWKSTKPKDRQKQVALIQTLATQVMIEDGWVLFHFDGDRAWSERESSENVAKFQTLVQAKVQALLVSKLTNLPGRSAPQDIEARAQARMTRLKPVVPFYSIEAWLFQNTREAIRLSQQFRGGRGVSQFQSWAQDRGAVDEVLKPKEAVSLGASYNLDLATNGFPAHEVKAAGKSFAVAVDKLAEDSELKDALARTYAYGSS